MSLVAEPGTGRPSRVLVAGVGYLNLRDLSVGPLVVDRLAALDWPTGVEVEDLSYGPVAVVHRLREENPPFGRIVLVAGVQRSREPGTVTCYRWDGRLPAPGEIQARVEEALTGVIDLDNLLIVTRHFDALPDEVIVVEVEPRTTGWGEGLSELISSALEEVVALVRAQALAGAGDGAHGQAAIAGMRASNGR